MQLQIFYKVYFHEAHAQALSFVTEKNEFVNCMIYCMMYVLYCLYGGCGFLTGNVLVWTIILCIYSALECAGCDVTIMK